MKYETILTLSEQAKKIEALRSENEALRAKRNLYKTMYRELITMLLGLSAKPR